MTQWRLFLHFFVLIIVAIDIVWASTGICPWVHYVQISCCSRVLLNSNLMLTNQYSAGVNCTVHPTASTYSRWISVFHANHNTAVTVKGQSDIIKQFATLLIISMCVPVCGTVPQKSSCWNIIIIDYKCVLKFSDQQLMQVCAEPAYRSATC